MSDFTLRTKMLLCQSGVDMLKNAHVLVLGLGGVGSYSAEALARAGVGSMTICDHDTISVSNINRQLCALHSTVGRKKCDVIAERISDINPDINLTVIDDFYSSANRDDFFSVKYDYIIDAIDSTSSKIDLICTSHALNIPIISSMGTGNKLDPTQFQITTLDKTSVCPLARIMRYELRKRNITKHEVLFSTEQPLVPLSLDAKAAGKHTVPGSVSWVPSCAGLMLAGHVIRKISGI